MRISLSNVHLVVTCALTLGCCGQAPAQIVADEMCPAWSSDPDAIITPHRNVDGNFDLYLVSISTGTSARITSHPGKDAAPSWSPDGSRLVFQSNRDGNWNLFIVDRDGSNLSRLTADAGRETHPSWSPNGSEIAFQTDRDGNSEIYIMNVDGSGATRVTSDASFDGIPHWSPSGDRIAFSSRRSGLNDIYVVDRATGTIENVTNTLAVSEYVHDWSPDGLQLSYWATSDSVGSEVQDIFALDLQSLRTRQLVVGYDSPRCPSWSPLGDQIVFASTGKEVSGMFVITLDGLEMEALPSLPN